MCDTFCESLKYELIHSLASAKYNRPIRGEGRQWTKGLVEIDNKIVHD